jgi:hypothetical protein
MPGQALKYQCGLCEVVADSGPKGEPPPGWELSEPDPIDKTIPRYWMCCRCQKDADEGGDFNEE